MTNSAQAGRYQPRAAWAMTAMMLLFMLVNFLDKVALGMVAVPLMAELHMSPAQFGLIAGSFYWVFSISAIIVGFLSARIATRWMLLVMGVAWAVLQLPIAFAGGAVTILLCRVLLGVAEGPAFPVSVHALYKWFPDEKRSLPVAVISQGACLGLLLAGLLIPLVTHRWGWRMNFVVLGAAGGLWSVMWACVGREGQLDERRWHASTLNADSGVTVARLPYRKILRDPSVLALLLLGFAAYWMLGLTLTWLPAYLQKGLGFDSVSAGRWFALVVIAAMPVTVGLSWLSQRMLKRGATTRAARARLVCLCALTSAVILIVLVATGLPAGQKAVLFALAGALSPLAITLGPVMLGEMVPASQCAALVAIFTAVGNVAGAIAPAVMGRLVQTHGAADAHGYEAGILCGAVLLVVAAFAGLRWLYPGRSRQTLMLGSAPAS
ncbi:MFS transporter [Paraburkholderia domus]|uniref:MFS transporter n=1 Tax=Paraburkholderia domus TaxID=2793075 RepID=UPI001B0CA3C6|nr:MFS transporter [Paraburkholderia domus]CAE6822082.1 Hexuronate transporter [Paraburkholderia domus]